MERDETTQGKLEVERVVRSAWHQIAPAVLLTEHTNLFTDLGASSLGVISVTERVQDELDVDVSVQVLFDNPRLGAYIRAVQDELAREGSTAAEGQA